MVDKVRIGWLQSDVGIHGGSEMSCGALVDHAPDWAKIVYCPPNKRPPDDIECYVVQNSTTYDQRWLEILLQKPTVKHVRDPWYAGDGLFRRCLLEQATLLIFSSQAQVDAFGYPFDAPHVILPPPVNLESFRQAAKPKDEREGAIFVGRVDVYKGAPMAVDWAYRTGETLALIGTPMMDFGKLPPYIRVVGEVPYQRMPSIMGNAKSFVFFPQWPEAFGRTVAEAWAAGCELIVDGRIGAMEYIENEPERLGFQGPIDEFWAAVESVL